MGMQPVRKQDSAEVEFVVGTCAGVMAMAESQAVLGHSWVGPKWRKTPL